MHGRMNSILDTRRARKRRVLVGEFGPLLVKQHQRENNQKKKLKEKLKREMEEKKTVLLKSRFKRVCVFCGSSTGKRDCYSDAALELGKELVHRGGGHVLGIIPKTLMRKEITGETVGEVKPVADMHQRKAEMARNSDCFIALPGVGLINVDGYYNSLLNFIDKAVDDGFISPSQRSIIVSAPNATDLVQKLEEYVPVHDGVVAKAKWEAEQVELNTCLKTEIAR
ncbi:hypothetical protein JRO89_XS07G0010100 [Xanthoceras sorbifolium]|uniref:cytokinin riboside 5'-monophosphate phosphoribohydrolase n=1 Tax=Xanthoceras sorbifolium TaxID=99658 RepID=A0ABQ8HRS4_9ROSI|nr:hypothetical protein JRO89_XS07G0010100 [Xanthoceras sorbifolium]